MHPFNPLLAQQLSTERAGSARLRRRDASSPAAPKRR
jgi:hypothetical protein